MIHRGTIEQLKSKGPFDAVLHPVERRGGCWGYFIERNGTPATFQAPGYANRKGLADKARWDHAALISTGSNNVAVVNK